MQKRRFWWIALAFGVVMFALYAFELVRFVVFATSSQSAHASVMERHESIGTSLIFYKYDFQGKTYLETKVYRAPEKFFVTGLAEGQHFEVIVADIYPEWSIPRRYLLVETILTLVWTCLAGAVIWRARSELRRT